MSIENSAFTQPMSKLNDINFETTFAVMESDKIHEGSLWLAILKSAHVCIPRSHSLGCFVYSIVGSGGSCLNIKDKHFQRLEAACLRVDNSSHNTKYIPPIASSPGMIRITSVAIAFNVAICILHENNSWTVVLPNDRVTEYSRHRIFIKEMSGECYRAVIPRNTDTLRIRAAPSRITQRDADIARWIKERKENETSVLSVRKVYYTLNDTTEMLRNHHIETQVAKLASALKEINHDNELTVIHFNPETTITDAQISRRQEQFRSMFNVCVSLAVSMAWDEMESNKENIVAIVHTRLTTASEQLSFAAQHTDDDDDGSDDDVNWE